MIDLPDVNIWLALVDENHVHHPIAQDYWLNHAAPSMAFCRVTMLGFLRLSTHPRVLSRPLSSIEAWNIYQQYLSEPDVCLLHESAALDAAFKELSNSTDFPRHLWTDAYIAALAMSSGCRVVSFDSDFKRFAGIDFLHLNA